MCPELTDHLIWDGIKRRRSDSLSADAASTLFSAGVHRWKIGRHVLAYDCPPNGVLGGALETPSVLGGTEPPYVCVTMMT